MFFVVKFLAQLPDALRQGIIRRRDTGPHHVKQLLLGNQAAVILQEMTKHHEGLGPKVYQQRSVPQATSMEVQRETTEANDVPNGLVHQRDQRSSANDQENIGKISARGHQIFLDGRGAGL
jgi:hypothetical protein